MPNNRKYITTVILTDDPRQSGDQVRLEGVSWYRLLQNGYVHDDFTEGIDTIVGRPVSIRAVELEGGVKGVEMTFMLLKPLPPGRYGIGPSGLVHKRDGKQVLECQIVSAVLTDRPADQNCYFTIEEEETDET